MPFSLVGFLEDIDPAGVFVNLAALADQHVRVAGDDLYVPTNLNFIVAVAAGLDDAAAGFARLVSPSIRRRVPLYFEPQNLVTAGAVEPGSPQAVTDIRRNPILLTGQEVLNAEISSNPAVAQDQWVLVWLADGPIAIVEGDIFTTRATGATTLTANAWTNVPLVFADDLPRGRYQVVGLRPRSAGMVAARFVFIGGVERPGALGVDTQGDLQHEMFRYGGLGAWGEFEDLDPPSIDCLAISADTAQDFHIDLIQVREGIG